MDETQLVDNHLQCHLSFIYELVVARVQAQGQVITGGQLHIKYSNI